MAEDVAVLVIANAGIIERAGSVGGDAAERFVALALTACGPRAQRTAPPAVSPRRLLNALRRPPGHEPRK